MKKFLFVVVAATAFAAGAQYVRVGAVPSDLPVGGQRYVSPDGRFSFVYPAAWKIQNHWGLDETSFLTNFTLGERCCDMQEGDLKMDFGPIQATTAGTVQDLLREACTGGSARCRIQIIDGHGWARVDSEDLGLRETYLVTMFKGRVYRAVSLVPQGPDSELGTAALDRVIETFSLR